MKKVYEEPKVSIETFEIEDVITASSREDETPMSPNT